MKSVKGDVWLAIVVIVGAVIYLYMDMHLPEVRLSDPLGPKAFPALVGVGLISGALLLLLEGLSKARHAANAHRAAGEQAKAQADSQAAMHNAASVVVASSADQPAGFGNSHDAASRAMLSGATTPTQTKPDAQPRHPRYVLIGMVLWTIAYYYLFDRAGYALATSVFLLGLLSYFNRKRIMMNISIAVGVAVVLDLVFSHLLSVPMPTGILPF
jgi:putative tricarboxylic transport membrane protein